MEKEMKKKELVQRMNALETRVDAQTWAIEMVVRALVADGKVEIGAVIKRLTMARDASEKDDPIVREFERLIVRFSRALP